MPAFAVMTKVCLIRDYLTFQLYFFFSSGQKNFAFRPCGADLNSSRDVAQPDQRDEDFWQMARYTNKHFHVNTLDSLEDAPTANRVPHREIPYWARDSRRVYRSKDTHRHRRDRRLRHAEYRDA